MSGKSGVSTVGNCMNVYDCPSHLFILAKNLGNLTAGCASLFWRSREKIAMSTLLTLFASCVVGSYASSRKAPSMTANCEL